MMPGTEPKKTRRLFVAVECPDPVRQFLAERRTDLPGMRWTAPDNPHLTVRFIGEVSLLQAAAITSGLRDVRAEGFSLRLNGFGFFGRRPRAVLWAGVEASPALLELKGQVDGALAKHAGIKAPGGRFSPHITLGRAKQADREALRALMTEGGATLAAEFAVASFTLFSSVLNPAGAVYTAEERYPLGGDRAAVKRTGRAATLAWARDA